MLEDVDESRLGFPAWPPRNGDCEARVVYTVPLAVHDEEVQFRIIASDPCIFACCADDIDYSAINLEARLGASG